LGLGDLPRLSGGDIPGADEHVIVRDEQPTVRSECDPIAEAPVLAEVPHKPAGGQVPKANRSVAASGRQAFAVRGEREAENAPGVVQVVKTTQADDGAGG
jgi:hypothetical protein